LEANKKYYFQISLSKALDVAVINSKKWCYLNKVKDVFFGEVTPERGTIKIAAKYPDQGESYHKFLEYSVQ
ncbi:hypothetical protein ACFL1N_17350, partial [Thermodesulfobacteriota bacterium]